MSWKHTSALEERAKFVEEADEGEESIAELYRHYGLSHKTGYKWIERHASQGMAGLEERSRALHQQAQAIADKIRQHVLAARSAHRNWGPLKLKRWLENTQPAAKWPSASTIGEILHQAGLTHPRGKHLWVAPSAGPLTLPSQASDIWCADFKGNFDCQEWKPLRSAHHHRQFQPLSFALSTGGKPGKKIHASLVRNIVSGVWYAEANPHRQRRTLRQHRTTATIQCLS